MLWNQSTNQPRLRKSQLCLPVVFNHKNYCHTSNFYTGERKFCIFESYFVFYSGPVIYQSCLEALRRFVLSSECAPVDKLIRHVRSPLMMSLLRPTLMLIQDIKKQKSYQQAPRWFAKSVPFTLPLKWLVKFIAVFSTRKTNIWMKLSFLPRLMAAHCECRLMILMLLCQLSGTFSSGFSRTLKILMNKTYHMLL